MSGDVVTKTNFPVLNGYAPQGNGATAIPIILDFSSDTQIDFDIVDEVARGIISFAQSAWIDNARNPNELILLMSQTQQRLVIPARAQGMWPIIAPMGLRCAATTTPGAGIVAQVILLNVPMPMTQFGPVTVNGSFTPATGLFTDRSALLTGASQLLMPANGLRKGYMISNPSTNNNSIWVSFDGSAAIADYTCYEIMPGGNLPPMFNTTLADLYVIGTNGEGVNAFEFA